MVDFSDPISIDFRKLHQEFVVLQTQCQHLTLLKSVQGHRKHNINTLIRNLDQESFHLLWKSHTLQAPAVFTFPPLVLLKRRNLSAPPFLNVKTLILLQNISEAFLSSFCSQSQNKRTGLTLPALLSVLRELYILLFCLLAQDFPSFVV